jgi:hypothetical protein
MAVTGPSDTIIKSSRTSSAFNSSSQFVMHIWKSKNSYLSVLLHSGQGEPLALRVNLKKTYLFLASLSAIFIGLVLGTLLFFRQLENNRKLREALLESHLREKILADTAKSAQLIPVAVAVGSPGDTRDVASAPAVETSPEQKANAPVSSVRARISEVNSECAAGRCNVRLVVVPTGSTIVEGSVLVVLETEIPRIGTARATSSSQKRFFIYPGYHSKDELDLKSVGHLETKNFKMSRALNTNVDFQFGELLRPLAVNIFLFDNAKNLILHERRQIELGE